MLVVHNAGTRTGLVLLECALQSQSCDSDSDIARQVGKRATGGKGFCVHTVQFVPFALCTGESRVEWLCGYTEITPRAIFERNWTFADIQKFLIPRRSALAFEC
jgi:hypothetical protein